MRWQSARVLRGLHSARIEWLAPGAGPGGGRPLDARNNAFERLLIRLSDDKPVTPAGDGEEGGQLKASPAF